MSDTITQNFVQQFDTSLRMLAAQMESRLRMAVTDRGTITGESFTINNIDPTGDLPADNVRHGDTVFSDITHSARVVTMKDFFDALPLDRSDIPKMLVNPVTGGHYANTLIGKRNRKIDNLIYRACRDSQLLKDGTSTALPSGQKIAHGGTGMTKAKIIQARKPGIPAGEYDLAGFAVGAVEKSKILTGADVKPGDVLLLDDGRLKLAVERVLGHEIAGTVAAVGPDARESASAATDHTDLGGR